MKDIMDNAAIRLRSEILLAVKVELGQKEQDKDHNRWGRSFCFSGKIYVDAFLRIM